MKWNTNRVKCSFSTYRIFSLFIVALLPSGIRVSCDEEQEKKNKTRVASRESRASAYFYPNPFVKGTKQYNNGSFSNKSYNNWSKILFLCFKN